LGKGRSKKEKKGLGKRINGSPCRSKKRIGLEKKHGGRNEQGRLVGRSGGRYSGDQSSSLSKGKRGTQRNPFTEDKALTTSSLPKKKLARGVPAVMRGGRPLQGEKKKIRSLVGTDGKRCPVNRVRINDKRENGVRGVP